ncbi:melanocyte-stimulating hormone receptor-like [Orbicella faveolata]|uniref:melanocyte-stimulating hormone receptor-like n=1 Tax=Orbicella faveolata TaxID=48498 RepID=UPI0009E5D221|nr:melanocyte-stimulating hormone receptor-like [Orbicella faveolata]
MANSPKDGNNTTTQELFCPITLHRMHQRVFILTFNIPLSISAILGNVLIIVALQRVTSIHPPSKLLLACLASTDLCVGLITQPLYIAYRMSSEYSKHCHYLRILFNTIGSIFCGVSLLTLTAISVDRLLALLLRLRYRQAVTLRRVWLLVAAFWFSSTAIALTVIYSFRIAVIFVCIVLLTCIVTSTLCYTKIYLTLRHHQTHVQGHVQQGQPSGEGVTLNIARYRKTVSTALLVQVTLLACYLPYAISVGAFVNTGSQTLSLNFSWAVTVTLLLFNSTLNPLLYCWKMREVRKAVMDTMKQVCCSSQVQRQ